MRWLQEEHIQLWSQEGLAALPAIPRTDPFSLSRRGCVERTAPPAGTSAGCSGALVAGPGFQGAVVAGAEASFAVMAWASFWIAAP